VPSNTSSSLLASNQYYSSSGTLKVTNATVSLARRLLALDRQFTLANSLSYSLYQLKDYTVGTVSDGDYNNFNFNTTLSRNSVDQPTYPTTGSNLSLSIALTPPYSLFRDVAKLKNESSSEKYKFVEYHKWMVDYSYFTKIVGKLVVNTRAHFGVLGTYNASLGTSPFERFKIGGNGLTGFSFILGYDLIGLRGYNNDFLAAAHKGIPAVAYNKFVTELRYPISLNPMATVFVLGFAEGGNSVTSVKDYNPFQIYRSAGVGARIFMPAFGMIGLDYAFPFDKVPGTANGFQNFVFTIGQQIR
jgi:outer membrane protein insertion porin family